MLLTIVLGLLTAATLYIRFWFKGNFSYWNKFKVPSAKGSFFSGNLRDFITMKTSYIYHLKTIYDDPKFKNEAVVGVYGAYKPALLIRDPELLKAIFIKDFEKFHDRSATCDPHHDPIAYKTLFFAPYTYWKGIRSKFSPLFSSAKIKYMYVLMQEVGTNLEENLRKKGDRFVDEIKYLAGLFTTDSIATTVLGFQSNSLQNPEEPIHLEAIRLSTFNVRRALAFLFLFFIPPLVPVLRIKAFFQATYDFISSSTDYIMTEREKSGEKRNDVIDILVQLKQEAAAAGEDETLTKESLFAQACILMAGGFETSSIIISSALFELAKQPKLLERLRNEALEAFLEGDGLITYERLNSMEYLRMVVDETLRKYPVLPLLDRKYAAPDNKTGGYSLKPYYDYDVPDGMPIYISAYALHYDPKYWPNPTNFDPERFSAENRKDINSMTYIPFGTGPRNCVGSRLGVLQVKIAIVHLLKNHYVQVCDQTVLEPEFEPKAFVLTTKGGIHLEVIRDNMYDNAANK